MAFSIPIIFTLYPVLIRKESSKSYPFDVETGDTISITPDTSNGPELSQDDGTFAVSDEDDNDVLNGSFITADQYSTQMDAIKSDPSAAVIDEKDNYIFWDFEQNTGDTEHDRMLMITDVFLKSVSL